MKGEEKALHIIVMISTLYFDFGILILNWHAT